MKDADRERAAVTGSDDEGIGNEDEAAHVGSSIRDVSKPTPSRTSLATSGIVGPA
jgi:hypothetical protein